MKHRKSMPEQGWELSSSKCMPDGILPADQTVDFSQKFIKLHYDT